MERNYLSLPVHGLKAALRWMRAHAHEYSIDSSRTGVMDGSAGGTLAALLGTTGDLKEFEGNGTHPGLSTVISFFDRVLKDRR